MKLAARLDKLEKLIQGNNDDVFIQVGLGPDDETCPSFTLYGAEAREHVAKERAAGRLLNPSNDGSSGFHVYLSDDLEDGLVC